MGVHVAYFYRRVSTTSESTIRAFKYGKLAFGRYYSSCVCHLEFFHPALIHRSIPSEEFLFSVPVTSKSVKKVF